MQLSKNFTLAELTRSQTATRRGIPNEPDAKVLANLARLTTRCLQPIRDHYRKAVMVSSGYRSPALNAAIGGSSTSAHMRGDAADIEIAGVSNYDLALWCSRKLIFDQIILEFYTPGQLDSGWVHIGLSDTPRGQLLTAQRINGRTVYLPGLVK
jgi:zinc D-Ala-D-Ala carboxypeptidase